MSVVKQSVRSLHVGCIPSKPLQDKLDATVVLPKELTCPMKGICLLPRVWTGVVSIKSSGKDHVLSTMMFRRAERNTAAKLNDNNGTF